jgi:replicative DNA helicase
MNAHTQTPINATEIEQYVLGTILMNGALFARISDILSPDDFAEELHGRIFGVIAELAKEGTTPGLFAVRPCLGEHALGDGITTGQYLARLCAEGGAVPALLTEYAKQIRSFASWRRMGEIADAMKAASTSFGGGASPAKFASELVSSLDPIIAAARSSQVRRVSIGDAAESAASIAFDRMSGKPTRTLATGLADLDSRIGGLEPGEFSIIAGRPSMGKTAVVLEIGRNVAKEGKGVLYFSLEMGGEQLAYRVISSTMFDTTPPGSSPLYYSSIARGRMNDREAERMEQTRRQLKGMPLEIDPESGLSMAQIAARVRRMKEEFAAKGVDLALVIIDHLGLVRASSRYSGNRTNEMGEISAACKALAKDTDTHVMSLSQLNRAAEGRSDKRPILSDLRESGNLEQDADLVIGAFREAYYLQSSAEAEDIARMLTVKNVLELVVLKQRQGPVGSVALFAEMGANAIRDAAGHNGL